MDAMENDCWQCGEFRGDDVVVHISSAVKNVLFATVELHIFCVECLATYTKSQACVSV